MSNATLTYNKVEVEAMIKNYLESRNITVKSVAIEVGYHAPDRPWDSTGPYFDKAVVEIDPGNVVAQED